MKSYTISGKLTKADSNAIKGASIRIEQEWIPENVVLTDNSLTGDKGEFTCQFNHKESSLKLRVAAQVGGKEVAEQFITAKAEETYTVHLVEGNEPLKAKPKLTEQKEKLATHIKEDDLVKLDENQIKKLSRLSGLPVKNIHSIKRSLSFANKHGLDKEVAYAFINAGYEEDIVQLATMPEKKFYEVLNQAGASGRISEDYALPEKQTEIRSKFRKAAVKQILEDEHDQTADIRKLAEHISFGTEQKKVFADILLDTPFLSPEFMDKVKENPLFNEKVMVRINRIRLVSELSDMHESTMNAFKKKIKSESEYSPLFSLTRNTWRTLVKDEIKEIPEHITGETEEERIEKYASELYLRVEQRFPGDLMNFKVARSKALTGDSGKDVKSILNKSKDLGFDFSQTEINTFFYRNKDKLSNLGVKNPEGAKEELKSWQRLYKIIPEGSRYENTEVLRKANLGSASEIVDKYTQKTFKEKFGKSIGNETAEKIYRNAKGQLANTLALAQVVRADQMPKPEVVIVSQETKDKWKDGKSKEDRNIADFQIPDFATLFGNQNYCSCKHCRSVLSPAAYLVDLLQFLEKSSSDENSAGKEFFRRRPDIRHIKLNCQNTNTSLPYIDLVNEVLEHAVVGDTEFEHQTTRKTEELKAMPEHINSDAYKKLGEEVFPFNLPFYLWNEEGSYILDKWGYKRHELLREFNAVLSSNIVTANEIAHVHLNLSKKEFIIISGRAKTKVYWGFKNIDTDTVFTELCKVQEFLNRSQLSYSELLQLIQIPALNFDDELYIDFEDNTTCDLESAEFTFKKSKIKLSASSHLMDFFDRTHRIIRLNRKTGLSFIELGMILKGFNVEVPDKNFLIKLSDLLYIRDKYNLELEEALSWFAPVNTLKDKNDAEARSLYERLFLNNSIENPASEDFKIQSDFDELKGNGNDITNYKSFICSALEISDEEYQLLIETTGILNLGIAELSILYRYVSLSKVLQISLEELVRLLSILGFELFVVVIVDDRKVFSASVYDTEATLSFIEKVEKVQNSVFSISEFIYLLTLEDLDGNLSLTSNKTESITSQISNLQQGLSLEEINAQIISILSTGFNITEAFLNQYFLELYSEPPADPESEPTLKQLNTVDINYEHLHLTSIVINKLRLSEDELSWYYANRSNTPIKWRAFHELANGPQAGRFESFQNLLSYASVCSKFGTEDIQILDVLFEVINKENVDILNKATSFDEKLSMLTGWQKDQISDLTEKFGIKIIEEPEPANKAIIALKLNNRVNGKVILAIEKILDLVSHFGVTLSELESWLEIDLSDKAILSLRSSLRSRYSEQQWYSVGAEIRNQLRQKQRDALSAFLIQRNEKIKDNNDLFDRYLLDTEMEPCMLTSRIKQAISSVQLFIHQAMMGLVLNKNDKRVKLFDDDTEEEFRELWEWMMNYRVWEANRKVFLYPENYLLPELRLSKSELFEQLENDLAKNELDEDYVKETFIKYLEGLEHISNLVIVASCKEETDDEEGNSILSKLHVFGRTQNTPYEFYYRSLDYTINKWSAWEKINLSIEGEYLVPCMLNGRLFIFWLQFKENTVSNEDIVEKYGDIYADSGHSISTANDARAILHKGEDEELGIDMSVSDIIRYAKDIYLSKILDDKESFYVYFDLQLAFSEYQKKSWSATKLSSEAITTDNEFTFLRFLSNSINYDRSAYAMNAEVLENEISISIIQNTDSKSIFLPVIKEVFNSNPLSLSFVDTLYKRLGYEKIQNLYFLIESETIKTNEHDRIGHFTLDYATKKVEINQLSTPENWTIKLPDGNISFYTFSKPDGKPDKLKLNYQTILAKTTSKYLISVQEGINNVSTEYDFFFNDTNRSYRLSSNKLTGVNNRRSSYIHFENVYHPFIPSIIEKVYESSLAEGLSRKIQLWEKADFDEKYSPQSIVNTNYPVRDFDFVFGRAYSLYNWELFFHIPLLIATKLSTDNKFEEAQKWLHYIFDPRISKGDAPQRYWQLKPFYEEEETDSITELLYALSMSSIDSSYVNKAKEVTAQIEYWKDNPFDPHAVAEMRISSYMMSTVFAYVDNLVRWGDYLFQQDTLETINEATNLYILAARLLGKRPEEITKEMKDYEALEKTYNELSEEGFDAFSNSLVKEIESYSIIVAFKSGKRDREKLISYTGQMYFCVPGNDKMLGYWDTVADRLFKIRNCQNIDGQFRMLPLFEPPIDPMLLIRAKAMGLSISDVLYSESEGAPKYRFNYYLQKAMQYASDLQSLGGALLSALEKRDAEELALLRSGHEKAMLSASMDMKKLLLKEAKQNMESMLKQKDIINERLDFYSQIEKLSSLEKNSDLLIKLANDIQLVSSNMKSIAAMLSLLPGIEVGFVGLAPSFNTKKEGWEKPNLIAGDVLLLASSLANSEGLRIAKKAAYQRRWDDWKLQERLAKKELAQIEKQILAAEIRVDIAKKDIKNLELQMEQQQETYEFMTGKYTNKELHDWMSSQISTVFYSSYELARKLAVKAQNAYNFELGLTDSFIRHDNWDSLKKGLLCGEKLTYDLKRMEVAYMENDVHDYELTKHISLALLDPFALIYLKETGTCRFEIPEVLFDLDFPGQVNRRIKSVSISIPCIAGPYTSISAKLTLENAEIYRKSIATSHAQNDSGVFELNFNGEKYLPFEGATAASSWLLELPAEFRQFDYNSIADVILHVKYTSDDGGDEKSKETAENIKTEIEAIKNTLGENGLYSAFSLKHDFPNEWHQLISNGEVNFKIEKSRLPYLAQAVSSTEKVEVIFLAKTKNDTTALSMKVDHIDIVFSWLDEVQLYQGELSSITLDSKLTILIQDVLKENLQELYLIIKFKLS